MGKDFRVSVPVDSERGKKLMAIFGRVEVCVIRPAPILVRLQDFDEPQSVYMLDLAEITAEEYERVIAYLVNEFKADEADVRDTVARGGVPLLASECTLTIYNPQKYVD